MPRSHLCIWAVRLIAVCSTRPCSRNYSLYFTYISIGCRPTMVNASICSCDHGSQACEKHYHTKPAATSAKTATTTTAPKTTPTLNFWEHLFCGARNYSLDKVIFHSANVAKTILQTLSQEGESLRVLVRQRPGILWRGTAAQIVLFIQGPISFAIVEETCCIMGRYGSKNNKRMVHRRRVPVWILLHPSSVHWWHLLFR